MKKNILKKVLPKSIKEGINRVIKKRVIINYYKRSYKKRALLSYVVYPFIFKNNFKHTNYFEATTLAYILDKQGYQVDIVNFDNSYMDIDLTNYDLICGFGDIFEKHFNTPESKAKTIIYATGMHNYYQNQVTLKRVKEIYERKGVWLGSSSRYVKYTYSAHCVVADATIALGNDICADSYRKYCENVYQLNAPFFRTKDCFQIIENKNIEQKKHFLWFGSSGAIHKGLDLLLEYFNQRDDIYLHIVGNINAEEVFVKTFQKELYETPNIFTYGFVNINSKIFEDILKKCAFIIFPSCSEGGSPSVLTCIGNGGLIPIITKETTIDTGYEIWIEQLNIQAIENAVNKALSLNQKELKDLMIKNAQIVNEKNNIDKYKQNLEKILLKIIGE
jgi:hypothetical protein